MKLFESIRLRTSVRKYKSETPSKELLTQIVEAARQAPSACNNQPWKFYVVTKAETRQQLAAAYNREWFATAPAVIVVVGNHSQSWHRAADGKDHLDIDCAIAAEHLALAATAVGLSTCWVCNFDVDQVSKTLCLSADCEPIALFPTGYATEEPLPHKRKEFCEVVEFVD